MAQCRHCFREKDTGGACPFCGYDERSQAGRYPLALAPGAILNGRYTVGHVIGQGGFGITYIAQDYRTKDRVAVKEYLPTELAGRSSDGLTVQVYSGDREENFLYGKEQFLAEAKTLASFLGDEHIVRIHSYFEENGTAYFVMEYVDGLTLDKYMAERGGRLAPEEAGRLLLPLMESLGRVHEKGIVHRDIAPDNIIVSRDGSAKLIDFGAARYSTGEKSRSLDVILKHGFAPYEQYMRRGRQGPWTDVYALAATYYYAITGKIPPEAVERITDDRILAPSALGVQISPAQEDGLFRALEVNAPDRLQSMADFLRAMEEASDAGGEEPAQDKPKTGKNRQKLPLLLAALILATLVFFGVMRLTEKGLPKSTKAGAAKGTAASFEPSFGEVTTTPGASVLGPGAKTPQEGGPPVSSTPAAPEALRIRQIAAGDYHSVALLTDGTVRAIGNNNHGQCNTEDWKDIVAVTTGTDLTMGLKSDRTVVVAGRDFDYGVSAWKDIVKIAAGRASVAGLKADGTVVAAGGNEYGQCDVSAWNQVEDIDAGFSHFIGIRADRTLVLSGFGGYEQRDVDDWTDIEAVSANAYHLLGLKSDGTVIVSGEGGKELQAVSGWTDVTAIATGSEHVVGLKSNGTVVAAGANTYGQCDVSAWTDIVAIAASRWYTLGLKADGTMVAAGYNDYGQCDVSRLYSELDLHSNGMENADPTQSKASQTEGVPFDSAAVGDTVLFGAYEQDNDPAGGKEAVEWLVLEKKDDRLLVISKYALDSKAYHADGTAITWEGCSLRTWLNEGFLNEAFSETERARILTVKNDAIGNPDYYKVSGGNSTQDRVFLLSIQEAERYFSTNEDRQCVPTEFAGAQGCTVNAEGLCWYWLRTPGHSADSAAYVSDAGLVYTFGNRVSYTPGGIRPSMWIDLTD